MHASPTPPCSACCNIYFTRWCYHSRLCRVWFCRLNCSEMGYKASYDRKVFDVILVVEPFIFPFQLKIFNRSRNCKLEISTAHTKAKSRKPAYSQTLIQNKIDRQRIRFRESGRQANSQTAMVMVDGFSFIHSFRPFL